MPAKSLTIEKPAKKRLTKLPLHIHKKIITSLKLIQQNPVLGIKLHGELEKYYKYRVGDYRIVYAFDVKNSTVIVVKIEHRQGVYR